MRIPHCLFQVLSSKAALPRLRIRNLSWRGCSCHPPLFHQVLTFPFTLTFTFFFTFTLLLPPTIISPGSNLHFHFLFSLSLCSSHPQLFHQVPTSIRVDIQHSRCWRFLCACLPRSLSDSESQYGWVPVLAITLVQSARIIGFMSIIQLLIAESFQTNIRFLNTLKLAFC